MEDINLLDSESFESAELIFRFQIGEGRFGELHGAVESDLGLSIRTDRLEGGATMFSLEQEERESSVSGVARKEGVFLWIVFGLVFRISGSFSTS